MPMTLEEEERARKQDAPMREALEALIKNFEQPGGSFVFDRHWADIARAALAQKEKTDANDS